MLKKDNNLNRIHKKIKSDSNEASVNTLACLPKEDLKVAEGHTRIKTTVDDPTISTWNLRKKFFKVFDVELKDAFKRGKLSLEDIGFLTLLSTYIEFDDNMLRRNNTYLSQKDISNILGWSRDKTRKVLDHLLKNKMVRRTKQLEDKRKYKYYINPKLIYRGRIIETSIKNRYSKE
jgi:DNA-binding MarR family transcriptional regulator